ncbi:MAG: SDR family NAD(P)-dependent oxidoreductase, partial [Ilumatobacteraceae bacterium]
FALRRVFGADADRVVIANTKGFTGHPMAVGLEDVVAIKALETGIVPPVANYRDPDPELGALNLSKGGSHPVEYALRLAAGFGSQISMLLLRRMPSPDGRRHSPDELGATYRVTDLAQRDSWLARISGDAAAELQVVQRRLRLVDHGPAPMAPVPVAVPVAPVSTTPVITAPVVTAPVVEAPPVDTPPIVVAPSVSSPLAATKSAETAPPPTVSIDTISARIVALVAEQTGYPADMLAPDLDLEADLGIDTVKQAELFATIREEYAIPRDDKLQLRDYPTINHILGFVRDRTQPTTPVTTTETAPEASPADTTSTSDAFPRRVPVVVLRPPLEHCAPTRVTLDAGSRVVVMADSGGVAGALVGCLQQRGVEALVVDDAPSIDDVVARLGSWRNSGAITGMYWLAALDDEGPHSALDAGTWRDGLRLRVKLLAAAMHALYDDIAPVGTFLVTATRLGGQHGYGPDGATAPMGGAVTGFTKAYARERADALVKSVDFAVGDDATMIAEQLVAETLSDPGTTEIGHAGDQRWSIALAERPAVDGGPERSLTSDSVYVITGAAGSIVSAITIDLAAQGGTFHLLDLIAEPDPADPDLARSVTDRDGLKHDLAERIAARGERATPALVERELARLERAKAAADTIEAVRRAGGTALWHQVDLTDSDSVAAVLGEVRASHARVDVLLHAAGLEISHTLDTKPATEFDLVFDVKSDGWFNLLHGLGDTPLGTAVVFSSIAGRFGNGGQTDYSAANDLLCKSIANFRSARPGTRGVAIDWTAWANIGMASRGSIPKMMALAGIDMLPPEIGVPVVRREITAAGQGGEVVVAGSLGLLAAERDGFDPVAARSSLGTTAGPMLGVFTGWTLADGLTVHDDLDPTEQSFLDHHRIDGTPVLPGVMGIEGFAESASASATGWRAVAVEDVAFLAPCKFFRDEPRTLEFVARPCADGDEVVADCRLVGRRSLANQPEQITTHFTGRVRLSHTPAPTRSSDPVGEACGTVVDADDIYRIYFHGPAYQVVDAAWRDGDRVIGRIADDLPPNHRPGNAPLLVEPRLIELCFQTAGIFELGTTGRLALPLRVAKVSLHPVPDQVGRWKAVVTPRSDGRGVDAVVIDDLGHVRIGLEAYETIALPGGPDDAALEPLRRAMQ